MKKIFSVLLISFILLNSLIICGCAINANDDNSYIISIYNEEFTQDANGIVTFEGYKLKETFRVIKTQCYEMPYEDLGIDNMYGGLKSGKYTYTGILGDYKIVKSEKIQVFPETDTTIFLREREKKSINLFYNNENISYYLEGADSFDSQSQKFLDTYEESFRFKVAHLKKIFTNITGPVDVAFYTNSSLSGEPFAKTSFSYSTYNGLSGCLDFNLIRTTNVYMKIERY